MQLKSPLSLNLQKRQIEMVLLLERVRTNAAIALPWRCQVDWDPIVSELKSYYSKELNTTSLSGSLSVVATCKEAFTNLGSRTVIALAGDLISELEEDTAKKIAQYEQEFQPEPEPQTRSFRR